ncbi:MAG: TonB-dependent receptor plug domain-containing protein, partial [Bacteroidetes bacterium]|nr:TonB-dependent receptor plug domain-containing protein [Bacteroidota bacterium]
MNYKTKCYQPALVKKPLLIMRILSIFLLSTTLTASAGGRAQGVTLSENNVRLEQVFKAIKKQTGYVFFYDAQLLKNANRVSINVKNEPVEKVLDEVFRGQPLDYSIVQKTITIVQRPNYFSSGYNEEKSDESLSAVPPKLIQGVVKDTDGNPLVGVSVVVKGTNKGTSTDSEGRFSIDAETGNVLEFTIVGYSKTTVVVGSDSNLSIQLKVEAVAATEVVIVGYGTQKKANLTGAVEQVSGDVLDNRSIPNVTQGLQGVIPNLNIVLADGKPTRTAEYQVRGVASIGQGGSALVLIDGVEGDPAMLNPNDIASVTVLKDAGSAAIYGARGAFGVVLITTKNPAKGRTSINYSTNFSIKSPTVVPDMVDDAYVYANMFVEAYSAFYDYSRTPTAFHKAVSYSQAWHDEMANRRPGSGKPDVEVGSGGKYLYYANTNWYDLLYKDHMKGNDHNISIEGGSDKADFMVSGRYYKQDGVFNYSSDDYSMYNLRAKGSAKIYDWLKVSNNMELSKMSYYFPFSGNTGNVW